MNEKIRKTIAIAGAVAAVGGATLESVKPSLSLFGPEVAIMTRTGHGIAIDQPFGIYHVLKSRCEGVKGQGDEYIRNKAEELIVSFPPEGRLYPNPDANNELEPMQISRSQGTQQCEPDLFDLLRPSRSEVPGS